MDKIRGFEIVSTKLDKFNSEESCAILPKRSTKNSAGYDFYAIEDITIPPNFIRYQVILETLSISETKLSDNTQPTCITTGIKAYMPEDEVLMLYPRSSWPSKLGLVLANSVGIIDSDYYNNPDNEGEIGFLVYNMSYSPITIKAGERLGQGVFTKFYKADNDDVTEERIGGYGSTGK